MITLHNINVSYDGHEIVERADLRIPEEAITLIRGVSGSGKTSLLYRVALISMDQDFDDSRFNHTENIKDPQSVLRKEGMSFVLQDHSLFDHYDVLGNMQLYAAFNNKTYNSNDYLNFLDAVNLDQSVLHQRIQTLSGGQRQRVAIACALCKDTPMIILDEPTSALDRSNEKHIFDILKTIAHDFHKTIVMSSHSDYAITVADQIYEISNQQLCEIKHYEELTSFTMPVHCNINISFYFSYIKYFFRSYKKFEKALILILFLSLLLVSICMGMTAHFVKESIASYENLSDNQMFITNDSDNLTIDSTLTPFTFSTPLEHVTIEPYVPIYASIQGVYYPIVPLYESNKPLSLLQNYDTGEDIYLSYHLYRELARQHLNLQNMSFSMASVRDGHGFEDDQVLTIGGITAEEETTAYFHNQKMYVYMDHKIVNALYQKYHLVDSQSFIGYTIIAESYDDYIKAYDQLKETNFGINLFFDHIDALDSLKRFNNVIKAVIMIVSLLISSTILYKLESMYFKQRNKEFMMLKMNGITDRQIVCMTTMETIVRCLIAFVPTFIVGVIVSIVLSIRFLELESLVALCIILLIVTSGIFNDRSIKTISVEKILRQ